MGQKVHAPPSPASANIWHGLLGPPNPFVSWVSRMGSRGPPVPRGQKSLKRAKNGLETDSFETLKLVFNFFLTFLVFP